MTDVDRLEGMRASAKFLQHFTMREAFVLVDAKLQERKLRTVRAAAGRLNCGKPAISRALDALSERDLIRREIDPDDKRSMFFSLTKKGEQMVGSIVRLMA